MLKFVDKEFIMEMRDTEGAIVIDADLQGAWAFGDQEQMRWAFPRAYDMYHRYCIKGLAKVGTCILVEDCGFKIVILFTKKHRKDPAELVVTNFNLALDDMIRKVPSDVYIYSPILGRADRCFEQLKPYINKVCKEFDGQAGYNWFIYNGKGKIYA